MAAHIVLPWVHRVFSNLKAWALGLYHGLRRKHLQAYLDEFVFHWSHGSNCSADDAANAGSGIGPKLRRESPRGHHSVREFGLSFSLHHSYHVSFKRLAGLSRDLFGLKVSEGAIANIFQATTTGMGKARTAIREQLVKAQVIASDETTTRINGVTHWHWVFLSKDAVLHDIKPCRAKSVAEAVLNGHRPEVWISDRYAGQQDLAQAHLVCLAHVPRDVQYAIDCGDSVFAPRIQEHLRWAMRVGKQRESLKDNTLKSYPEPPGSRDRPRSTLSEISSRAISRSLEPPCANPVSSYQKNA